MPSSLESLPSWFVTAPSTCRRRRRSSRRTGGRRRRVVAGRLLAAAAGAAAAGAVRPGAPPRRSGRERDGADAGRDGRDARAAGRARSRRGCVTRARRLRELDGLRLALGAVGGPSQLATGASSAPPTRIAETRPAETAPAKRRSRCVESAPAGGSCCYGCSAPASRSSPIQPAHRRFPGAGLRVLEPVWTIVRCRLDDLRIFRARLLKW